MLEPGRNYSVANTNYRYGFNGKEKSDEINGSGVDYNYGARIYDARLGKFLSVDPLSKSFAYYSPFQFAGNTPIQAIDVDGKEPGKREALQAISQFNNSVIATSTQFTVESAWAATFSSGMAVDPGGNVLMLSTKGGLAMLDNNINGGATNAGVSLTKNLTFYNSKIKSLGTLLGTSTTTNVGTSWKDVIVAGFAEESDNEGNTIGRTYSLGLGFAGLPNEFSSVKSKTSGIILTGEEYDKLYTEKEKIDEEGFANYNNWNYKMGTGADAPYQTIASGDTHLAYISTGEKDQYKLEYSHSFPIIPNELYWSRQPEGVPSPQSLTKLTFNFDTGITVKKDANGNYISDQYQNQQTQKKTGDH